MIHIRRAELSDAAQIQRVYASSGTYAASLQLPHPSVDLWQERLRQVSRDDTLLVAICDGVIVATAGLHIETTQRRSHVATLSLGGADSFTGRGVGSALLTELLSLSDNWLNLLRIELMVFCDSAASIHLYKKFGFDIEGTHRGASLRNGVFADSYSMARLHPRQPLMPVRQS